MRIVNFAVNLFNLYANVSSLIHVLLLSLYLSLHLDGELMQIS